MNGHRDAAMPVPIMTWRWSAGRWPVLPKQHGDLPNGWCSASVVCALNRPKQAPKKHAQTHAHTHSRLSCWLGTGGVRLGQGPQSESELQGRRSGPPIRVASQVP